VSLTNRLLLYFQATLAVVLVAFSASLFLAARWYVHDQTDERLSAAAGALVASVDIEEDNVEWEPEDRDLAVGPGPLGGTVYWFITDFNGRPVDQSPQPGTADLVAATGTEAGHGLTPGGWITTRRLVHPPGVVGPQLTRERTAEEVEKAEYPALVFVVGVRAAPVHTALNTLAVGLVGGSAVVWLAGLVAGRWVCRRALRPVTAMAEAARTMRADNAEARLPPPGVSGELDDLHTAITDLLGRLRDTIGRERRFTAEASHQLRTPLGTILGQVEVALRKPRSREEYERVLAVVRRQAAHLTQTVEALLFLARTEAEAGPPVLERIDLAGWVPGFLDSLADHPRHADLALDVGPGKAVEVEAHPPLLRELVRNLVDNALKYSPPDTPVTIRLGRVAGRPTLAVEDRGPGIPAADLPHLFEPFFRSSDVRRGAPGAGLGLTVAARIATAFGGRIEAASRPGEGTRFTVAFPPPAGQRPDEESLISRSREA
jgi:signal transduction histidine kinase